MLWTGGDALFGTLLHLHADTTTASLLLEHRGNEIQGLNIANKDGLIPIFVAAHKAKESICELLLSHNSYIHQICPQGLSLVHYAVKMNSIKILQLLRAKSFELTERTNDGRTGLHFISSGITPDIVRLLIESRVNTTLPAHNRETPLHTLSCLSPMPNAEVFDLLATKQFINAATTGGFTPLHYALDPPDYLKIAPYQYSLAKHAENLISRGADINMRLFGGTSCLVNMITKYIQFKVGKRHELEESKKESNHRKTTQILTALQVARRRMQETSKLVLTATTDLGMLTELTNEYAGGTNIRPLNWLIVFGDPELVDLLLGKGIDVVLRNAGQGIESSWSVLDFACWYGCSLEVFHKLLEKSTRIQECDSRGAYLIHTSCTAGASSSPSILEELCKAPLDPNLPMARAPGLTPLILAATSGKQDHIRILLNYGANIRITDADGREAAHWAAISGQTAIIALFLDFNIDWNCCLDNFGHNILHFAAANSHSHLVTFILQKHLIEDLDCRTAEPASAVALAASRRSPEVTQLLLEAGANVGVAGKDGMRPIHLAACSGNLSVIRVLLCHHCSLLPDNFGMTPQLTALKFGNQEAFNLLNEHEQQKG